MRALSPLLSELHGHAYTIGPRFLYGRGLTPPPTKRWQTTCLEQGRSITLSGLYSEHESADTLVIVMHGCGGKPTSHYAVLAAHHFYGRGISVLRLAWRGADLDGEDIYHAAQTADVHAAIACPTFARYRRIWLLGYSLGGHCCLHVAHESREPRVSAVATVCPVLHLMQTNAAIDAPERLLYRRYVLDGLRESYLAYAARANDTSVVPHVRKASTFRAYDALTVVPRYGFASVDDYYTRACASQIVGRIERPTLVVCARRDPMLPWQIADTVRRSFSPAITFRWAERGGHAGFPRDLDLGEAGPLGLEAQVYTWLERHSS